MEGDALGTGLGGLAARVEALVFAAGEPVTAERLAAVLGVPPAEVRRAARRLQEHLDAHGHGVSLAEIAGGYQLLTRAEHAAAVAALARPRVPPLSRAALETLAVVAFRQPVTRAAIDELRGVHSEGAVATLLERGLIAEAGRADAPGRPYLYVTTRRFLEHFGLRSLEDLPAVDGLAGLAARAAGESGAATGGSGVRSAAPPRGGSSAGGA